ncbi:efflux RND transporter periplasmic adaptor subunit [Chondromyces crocatus]|uniref:Secretion protein HlyD n=1 Tax=Chondromyces crocatus TaxID=52 RepID=A0A0K1EPG8_CHOCO|nr:HlyD family efflux transporter periplasmic adaptor subunit [Chondromyces crocatus]AKT42704.1 secretion protein HlyD [Chondromyces crocatus]
MRVDRRWRALALGTLALLTGCEKQHAPPPPPPVKAIPQPSETALSTLTLTPEAEGRLGIETTAVEQRDLPEPLSVAGEVIVPTDGAVVLAAPFSATVSALPGGPPRPGARIRRGDPLVRLAPFAPLDRDVLAQAERAVSVAAANLDALDARVQRLEKLLTEGGASTRQIEEARAERAALKAELTAGEKRLASIRRAPLEADVSIPLRAPRDGLIRSVTVAPGQLVAAGAPLFEILGAPTLWVRAAVYAGAAARLAQDTPALVSSLRARADADPSILAQPVQAPPSADPLSATVDLFYELPEGSSRRPGERVTVTLETTRSTEVRVVPWSSVVFDAVGGAWVYLQTAPHAYERSRIDLLRVENDHALFTRGPAKDARVVHVGAAELFGVEFGVGK